MIETRLLTYFLAIAREQSITKAAESLHITQPTLSKQMMELEEQLGTKLFTRGKRRVTLTEDGVYLRGRAQEMIELMEKTESSFRGGTGLTGGEISLGCGETMTMDFIVSVFREIQEDYPGVRFRIFSGDTETVLERLDKGLIDAALLLGPERRTKYDYLKLGMRDVFGLLMAKNCKLAEKEYVTVSDLLDVPLVLPIYADSGSRRYEWFGADCDKMNVVASYNLIYNASFMAERGVGCVFCLRDLVNISGRNLTFRQFSPEIGVDLYIVTKKYQTFSPAARVFLDRLSEKVESR